MRRADIKRAIARERTARTEAVREVRSNPVAPQVLSLPTPDGSYRGAIVRLRSETTLVEQAFICLINSAGGFEWVIIGQSS